MYLSSNFITNNLPTQVDSTFIQNELTLLPNCNGSRTNIQSNRNMDCHWDVLYRMYKGIVLRIPNPNNWHLVHMDLKHRTLDCFPDLEYNNKK